MTVRIVTVCTGNICRSPYAQLVLQRELDAIRPEVFEVTSVGTHAMVGKPVHPESVRHLDRRGIGSDHFAARQMSPEILRDADIALTMQARHGQRLLRVSPRHLKRAYTLKEFARLLDAAQERMPWRERLAGCGSPEERWAALPAHLARERTLSRAPQGTDELEDPYRKSPEHFDRMAEEVDAAVERIVTFVARF